LTRPFSESKSVATFLKNESGNIEFIAGGCGAAPLSAYIGKKMYYLVNMEYGSYCRFNRIAEKLSGSEKFQKEAAVKFAENTSGKIYFITHSPLHLSADEISYFHLINSFDKSALTHENFYVYQVLDSKGL
jgi:hypothetical protein